MSSSAAERGTKHEGGVKKKKSKKSNTEDTNYDSIQMELSEVRNVVSKIRECLLDYRG